MMKKLTMSAVASMAMICSSQSGWALSFGTGFLINGEGYILTNNHVVNHSYKISERYSIDMPCRTLQVTSRGVKRNSRAEIIAMDNKNDLAVIKISKDSLLGNNPGRVADQGTNREPVQVSGRGWKNIGRALSPGAGSGQKSSGDRNTSMTEFLKFTVDTAKPGTKINLFGYPRPYVSSPLKVTDGIVVANAGFWNNTSALQTNAATNPGVSGGPILNEAGRIVGIISSHLTAFLTSRYTVDVPQGYNFGIKSAVAKMFLDTHGVSYHTARSDQKIDTRIIYKNAQKSVVSIMCFGR